ncbi:hypothetical protein PLEOSDRAFT_1044280 [Pleurotus ostreatus PC15]|uniref:Fungal lipase-type domain-containing protein n=1 Tax=Pleurotus ostreatus (strain PC15) TaxID=1137138 RepID=A0A067NF68_PLEO1|nr:hypothetical protein PLEOSDRAFT_1044280 [Pleurotus ostreatus PC15]
MVLSLLSLAVGVFISAVVAIPVLETRQSITVLSSAQISAFKPYSFYASTAYCKPATTKTWTCGANCNANSGFQPVASGGDGSIVQFWYVGYDASLKSVIVAHQGTDTSKLIPLLTDADFFFDSLNPTLFPGISRSIQVHNGFSEAQARAAPAVLAAVKTAMSQFSATRVTIVGHSLGGAIALIDAVYLPLHLPSGTTFKTVTFGMPRVGNQAFANYVDSHNTSLTHINNKGDIVPIVPGRFLGFHHPKGEVHVRNSDSAWVSCPGQDSTAAGCTIDEVPNIFSSNSGDHFGPFDGKHGDCESS